MQSKEQVLRKVITGINSKGFEVIGINGESNEPSTTYSVGFTSTYTHPEIVFRGVLCLEAERCIYKIADELERGFGFYHGDISTTIITGKTVLFCSVGDKAIKEKLSIASTIYQGQPLEMLQAIVIN